MLKIVHVENEIEEISFKSQGILFTFQLIELGG